MSEIWGNNLDGKPTLYAIYQPSNQREDPGIFIGCASDNLDDLIERTISFMGDSVSVRESVDNHVRSHDVEDHKLYSIFFWHPSESALETGLEPIKIGTTYSTKDRCMNAVKCALNSYLIEYTEQQYKASQQESEQISRKIKRYTDAANDEIGRYVLTTYIEPLIQAKAEDDMPQFMKIAGKFSSFSWGSDFVQHVDRLCKDILEGFDETSLSLHVQLITELHKKEPDYIKAGQLRNQIYSKV